MESALKTALAETGYPAVVKAIILDGPQQGRIIQLRGEEVENAITPDEKKALEELFEIYNGYFEAKQQHPEAYQEAYQAALEKLGELKEKYRGIV